MSFTAEENDKFAFIEQLEMFRENKTFKLFRRIRDTRLPLYTLRSNYRDLTFSMTNFHKHVESAQFWDPATPYLRVNTQKQISKHLFNYLSSVCAIIDLSRRSSRKLLSKSQQVLYFQNIKEVFVESVEFRIVRNLRNYISHYSTLNMGVYSKKSLIEESRNAFYLHTIELLEWDEWDDEERVYLNKEGAKFEIEKLLREYHSVFMKTQDKYFLEIIKNHSQSLIELLSEMEKLTAKGKEVNMVNSLPFRQASLRWLHKVIILSENN